MVPTWASSQNLASMRDSVGLESLVALHVRHDLEQQMIGMRRGQRARVPSSTDLITAFPKPKPLRWCCGCDGYHTGTKDAAGKPVSGNELWTNTAIQKVDDYTIRLNGQQPMLAVPESLFHYPGPILDPKENGVFGVGSIAPAPPRSRIRVGQEGGPEAACQPEFQPGIAPIRQKTAMWIKIRFGTMNAGMSSHGNPLMIAVLGSP